MIPVLWTLEEEASYDTRVQHLGKTMVSRLFRPPALGRLRLACVNDAPIIFSLVNESVAKNFRISDTSDITYIIENGVLSVCHLDVNESIVGALVARDYPLIPSIHPLSWEEYVWSKYKATELNARNTLFLHLLCWNPVYARNCVDDMLKSIFMHDPYVQHIAMVKCLIAYPLLVPGQSRSEASFRRVQAMERGVPGDQLPALFIADRQEVSPRLRIRRAVEEDNDDIVPIIERHSTRLRQLYGDYYVSELISRHPESERVLLVCEHKEVAVGVMILNTQINYEALEESFELSPFAGLKRLNKTPVYKRSKDYDSSVNLLPGNNIPESVTQGSMFPIESSTRSKEAKSRVTWLFNDDEFKDLQTETTNVVSHSAAPMGPSAQLDILNLLEDEDEELEFDIVNIDRDLLRVPKLLSYDSLGQGPVETIMKVIDGTSRHARKESIYEDKNKKDKVKTASIGTILTCKAPEPIRYSGKPNAFLLEVFAMHPDYDESTVLFLTFSPEANIAVKARGLSVVGVMTHTPLELLTSIGKTPKNRQLVMYGFDMLEAAYELFPDRDYCVICLPSNHPSFPLLEHFTLVTPFSSQMRFINDTLYVAHINSVRGDVSVRLGEAFDVPNLFDVMEHAPRAQTLIDLFESTLTSRTLQSYVLLSQNQPIGMVVLGPLEDATAIRTQYDLEPEPRRPGTDGTILVGVMSPVMEPHGRWYLRELLRYSQYSTLFWICKLFAKGDATPSRNLMSLAGHMIPVRPRQPVPNISGSQQLDNFFKDVVTPFALWVLERPLSCLPKVYVNNNIVVVGASRTGLAFLENLLMGPTAKYLTFSNVTLVSEHGLPTVTECLRAADICVPRDGRYTDRYLKSVPFYFYVDVMSAVMVGIDRKKKCIHLRGGGVKYYDELVLTCGLQFQHPDYLSESLEFAKEIEKGKPCDRILMDNPHYHPDRVPATPDLPENVMLINSLFEANICLRKLLCMITDFKDSRMSLTEELQVIVYGECIEAYSCITALLELGLSPDMITFIEPFPSEDATVLRVNSFNNETVDERVQGSLEKIGIRVLRRCWLVGWRQIDNRVEVIHLMSQMYAICMPCFALFYYGLKAIDINAFRAINECGLVYDGGLVVNSGFETNDPYIYGAGTCVRYSRKLYATQRLHRYYCSEEVGEALAQMFLKKMDPFVMADVNTNSTSGDIRSRFGSSLIPLIGSHSSLSSATRISLGVWRKWQPVKKFEAPIVQSATLPGPLYYLKLRKPGVEIPMEVQLTLPHQGHILITDHNSNYFRLQLNVLHCVESVTCLSKKCFSSEIFVQLYGKHEAFFNKLLTRYQLNEIKDLYQFFTQPWMSALYQETFPDLLRDINEQDIGTVYDLVKSRFMMSIDADKSSISHNLSTCSDIPSCGFGPKDAQNLGTFRSVVDKFIVRTSSVQIVHASTPMDIPSECGQSEAIRSETAGFWKTIGGERIVMAHLARYINRNNVTNPHYAIPKHEFI